MNRKDEAKSKSIIDYLASIGYKPVPGRDRGKYAFYLSMLHNERHASFCVNKNKNTWSDYGLKVGGDIIDLVQTIENKTFTEALDTLLGKDLSNVTTINQESKPGIEVVNISPLKETKLLDYLAGRNIDIGIAQLYCEQVEIKFTYGKNPDKVHLYIGFKNDKDGYELRNAYDKAGKVSSPPKYYTTIPGIANRYNYFEGFIDYLQLLTVYKVEKFNNTSIVLNSLVNLLYLYPRMKNAEENNLLFDNDETADKYIWKGDSKLNIISLDDQGIPYNDRRDMYPNANDINDYYSGKLLI